MRLSFLVCSMNKPENRAFCILPWVHAEIRQTGDIYPCCRVSHSFKYGSVANNSLQEIWNSDAIKKVRMEMLAGKKQSFCSDCHKHEDLGAQSYRMTVNTEFAEEYSRIAQTTVDGHLNNPGIPYLDIRFSNICNFKCRTCNGDSSTSWHEDERAMNSSANKPKVLKITKMNPQIFQEIVGQLPALQYIYFAGGEPLLDEQHYLLLEKIIEAGRTDIVISYNTNLSVLNYLHWNVLKLWQNFKHLQLSVSIDAIGERLEYIRKGSSWSLLQKNLRLVRSLVPNALIQIYPTVSVLNCFHLPELAEHFLVENFIVIDRHFKLNILNDPAFLNVSSLSEKESQRLEVVYTACFLKLRGRFPAAVTEHVIAELGTVLAFAKSADLTGHRPHFVKFNAELDQLRKEEGHSFLAELDPV